MKGSDTLGDVARSVVIDCISRGTGLLPGDITYIGNGSGGQEALLAGNQRIAPMGRAFNGSACLGGPGTTFLDPRGEQLLIGLDAVSIVAANQSHGDSLFDDGIGASFGCADNIGAITLPAALIGTCLPTDNCNPDGSYTFGSWREVLAMIYGGQNNAQQPALSAAFPKVRNINKINCASPVRKALADNWGTLFNTDCNKGPAACSCIKLKHAFRRGDLSDATDTFLALAGFQVPIPPYTRTFLPAPSLIPTVDPSTATPNPFCNGGLNPMNKGDADYLDLDPIRRIADCGSGAAGRIGFEQTSQGWGVCVNPPVTVGCDTRPDPTLTAALIELPEYGAPNRSNFGPNPAITAPFPNDFFTLQKTTLLLRKGHGLVLPIEVPTNYTDDGVAFFSPSAAPGQCPVTCDPGVFAPTIPQSPGGVCPDARSPPCLFPVHVEAGGTVNFNCLVTSAVPILAPLKDNRVFNLLVVNRNGKYLFDNYVNPNLTALSASRQSRLVSAFFRLHFNQTTAFGGNPTIAAVNCSVCRQLNASALIGCLVKASPCSIGYASRQAVDRLPGSLNNLAFRLPTTVSDSVPPTDTMVSALMSSSTTRFYPMSRKLYVDHWVDPALPPPPSAAKEELLYSCFDDPSVTNPRISQFGFVPLPGGPTIDNACVQ